MHAGNAPSWLFSFVDLAFLLLIAMTQVGGAASPELGEITVPRIGGASAALPAGARERWQLRVHRATAAAAPFELVHGGGSSTGARLAGPALRARLATLRADRVPRPLLAPHEESRSRDLLEAVGLLEEIWPGRRRATVQPLFARR